MTLASNRVMEGAMKGILVFLPLEGAQLNPAFPINPQGTLAVMELGSVTRGVTVSTRTQQKL